MPVNEVRVLSDHTILVREPGGEESPEPQEFEVEVETASVVEEPDEVSVEESVPEPQPEDGIRQPEH